MNVRLELNRFNKFQQWVMPGASILLCVLAVLVPSGIWSPPPVSEVAGPARYKSSLGIGPQIVWSQYGANRTPDIATIKFAYKILSRPVDYSVLVSTSAKIEEGLMVTLDKWGNVYLSVQSVTAITSEITSEYQLIKISDPQGLEAIHTVKIYFNLNSNVLEISVDDRNIKVHEARPNRNISISDFVLNSNEIRLGGFDQHYFSGEISEFTMTFGRQGIRIDLINLRIFLLLLALGLTTRFFIRRKGINL